MANIQIKNGDKFNKLTFIKETSKKERPIWNKRYGIFRCDCGTEKLIVISYVFRGKTMSCGCLHDRQYGMSNTKIGVIWMFMNYRCYNKNVKTYKDYGARGITVCNQWRNDIRVFYSWCVDNGYNEGLQLDRIDNNKGYSPENCRFVTPAQNSRNKRNNIWVDHNGYKVVLKDYAAIKKVDYKKLHGRVRYYGMTPQEAVVDIINTYGVLKCA